jgi:hypothetical protein
MMVAVTAAVLRAFEQINAAEVDARQRRAVKPVVIAG